MRVYSLPVQVQELIQQSLHRQGMDIHTINERLSNVVVNTRNLGRGHGEHCNQWGDAHGIQSLILDVINAQLLVNSALELDSEEGNVPRYWDLIVEDGLVTTLASDDSRFQYGTKSLKFVIGGNSSSEEKKAYIKQIIPNNKINTSLPYSFSYFYLDEENDDSNFVHYACVVFYGSNGAELDRVIFEPSKLDGDAHLFFSRWREALEELHEDTHSVEFRIGVSVKPNCNATSAWIDYPMVNAGNFALNPGEVVEGIITTEHITTDGLDARVITTGELNAGLVTIVSDDGTIKIVDNLILISSGDEEDPEYKEYVKIGRYDDNKYGILIKEGKIELGDDNGTPNFSVDEEGDLYARKGFIANFIIDENTLKSTNERLILDSENAKIEANNSSGETEVTFGRMYGGHYGIKAGGTTLNKDGIKIEQGDINLGDGNFTVDNDGKLVAQEGKIANFDIKQDELSTTNNALKLKSAEAKVEVRDPSTGETEVILGQYENDKYGLKADGVTIDKTGIEISAGEIKLGEDPLIQDKYNFKVNNQGEITSTKGKIANFIIEQNIIKTLGGELELNADSSAITLSKDVPNYATIIQPEGIFGKVPLARLQEFDPIDGGFTYYIEIVRVYDDQNADYEELVDYVYNKKTGEVIKRKGSTMPDTIHIDYFVYDSRVLEDHMVQTVLFGLPGGSQEIVVTLEGYLEDFDIQEVTETVTFEPTIRASAIITDDSLLDASFIKNLLVGSAEIGLASINTAHIRELHGRKIIAHSIDANHLTIGKGGNLIPNSTFQSSEFYKDWVDLMLGSPEVSYNLVEQNYSHTRSVSLYDGACIELSGDNEGSYFGLDIQIGTILKPNTWYVFSAFHELKVPDEESTDGFFLHAEGDVTEVGNTDTGLSDNDIDTESHDWKRKAIRFKTGSSGKATLLSKLDSSSSGIVKGWIDGFMLEEGYNESDFYKSGTTRITGSGIETNTITLSQLNFTPVQDGSVVASINAEDGGLKISANKLELNVLRAKPRSGHLFRFEGNLRSTTGELIEVID